MADSDWSDTTQPSQFTGWADPQQPGAAAAPPRRRRRRALAAIGAGAAVAIAGAAVALGTSSQPAAATPAQELAAATHAAAALNSESAAVTMQLGSLGTVRGTFSWQRRPFIDAISMTEHVAGRHVQVSMIETMNAIYLRGGMIPGVPSGKWIKIPMGHGRASSLPMLPGISGMDPLAELRMLAAGHHLRAAGPATVDGVATTRYNGDFSADAGLKALTGSSQSGLSSVLKATGGDIPFSVWIDGSHQVRKFTENVSIKPVTMRLSMMFYGFNQPLTAKVPSASQLARRPGGGLGLP